MSNDNSRPHLFTYITTLKGQEGAIYPTDSKYKLVLHCYSQTGSCETVLSTGTVVVAQKSAAGVQTKPSFQALAALYIILKFYNDHVQQSELWLVLPTLAVEVNSLNLGKLPGIFVFYWTAWVWGYSRTSWKTNIHRLKLQADNKATQNCFPVSGPTSHFKMTRPPGIFFFFSETKVERKWCTNSKMHHRGWGLETRIQNASWRVRSGDKTTTKCRHLCIQGSKI